MTPRGQRVRRRRGPRPVRLRFGDRVRGAFRAVLIVSLVLFAVTGLAASGVYLWHFAQTSEFFRLQAITVEGVSPPIEAEMRALMEDVEVGERTLFNVSPRLIRARLCQHPRLEPDLVTVGRQWPDTLAIQAVERQPLARVAGPRLMLVDRQGWVIEQSPDAVLSEDLPILSGIDAGELIYGERIDEPGAQRLLEWVAAMRHHMPRLHRRLSELNLDQACDVTAVLVGGGRVRLGDRAPQEQMPVLLSFTREFAREVDDDLSNVALLDLRMEDHLVYRRADAVAHDRSTDPRGETQ